LSRLLVRREAKPMVDGSESLVFLRPSEAAELSGERWEHVGFAAHRWRAGGRFQFEFHPREVCLVGLEGTCVIRCGERAWKIGERSDPFEGPPAAAYLPPGSNAEIEAVSDATVAIGYAPAEAGPAARELPPSEARLEVRGSGAMERRIHHILMEDQPASSLLVTEVVTPAGHWSSYPPHKHDTDDPPRECQLEEIYYFRFRDPRGFGLMRVYTADRSLDETIAVRDGDLVLVPRGYHTFAAAPGYEAYYLNVMAGPRREWKISFDPDHDRMRW
jgi:5-deoxy-glucuronate isomerase